MNIIAIFGILASTIPTSFSRNCNQMPWIKNVDLFQISQVYDGRLFVVKSLDNSNTCGIRNYYQLNKNLGLVIVTNPETLKLAHFLYINNGGGNWQRMSLETGIAQPRRVFALRQDSNGGGFACVYTCNGNTTDRFDCLATSLCYADDIDRAIKEAGFDMNIYQRWSTCKKSPFQYGCCNEHCPKYGNDQNMANDTILVLK